MVVLGVSFFASGQDQFISNYVEIEGRKVHYLDFGGEGLPIILLHSEAWDAYTFKDFGGRLNTKNRVLAITRPGYGESEPLGYDVPTQAEALLSFAKAMGIEKAIYLGNGSTTCELTYLGENYKDQVAGLIYLNGLATPWLDIHNKDPNRAFEMFRKASPGANDKSIITESRKVYKPGYHIKTKSIQVPSLAFVNSDGLTGGEKGIPALLLVGSKYMNDVRKQMSHSPVKDYLNRLADSVEFRRQEIGKIKDIEARQFFLKLNVDHSLQKQIFLFHKEKVLPAMALEQSRFVKSFGDYLELERLDVVQVVGYEYRDSPELILHHMLDFIQRLNAR